MKKDKIALFQVIKWGGVGEIKLKAKSKIENTVEH